MYQVKYEDLSEKVYKAVKLMILEGQLTPGQKVKQEELAERLGVSRTPLLSALSMLEKELLIESIPRRGYIIRKTTLRQLLDLFEIRIRLEPLGAIEAAGNFNDPQAQQQIQRLKEQTHAIRQEPADTVQRTFKQYDFDFHSTIMDISNNEFLPLLISSYNLITLSNISRTFRDPFMSIAEHEQILGAIENGNAQLASQTMRDHIEIARSLAERAYQESLHDSH
ncbi:MAG: GntR family transcriptional regulator [Spirochaetia bacterium]|nr:GntR family transcriptional regulator [Spirochaetia bacterium]